MTQERDWKRIRERLALQLPVRVHCRETPDFGWTEITRLINVTPFGAGFTLKRPTEKGRLVHMTIPMPRQLRVFDHVEDQYRIWAIVRHLKNKSTGNEAAFEMGVAFIGKRAPASYEAEPWKRYDVTFNPTQQLATINETPLVGSADDRQHTRHNIAVDMRLELVDQDGAVIKTEQTVTENISAQGATLFTTLEILVGRFVRITSEQYRMTVYAAVRSRSTGADGVARIHVEFIDKLWPL